MFSGSIPALATPFRDGSFDEAAFRKLVDWQIDNGSKALVPCGTTGETSTLSMARRPSSSSSTAGSTVSATATTCSTSSLTIGFCSS